MGASAGGLQALKGLLHALPRDPEMAFLVVQHLDPHQPSMLVDLLADATVLPVKEAQDGAPIQADHIYVGPPNRVLTLHEGLMRLGPVTDPRGRRFPIDALFRSVAEDQGDHAVGVILSGTGTDGTGGLASLKDKGGVVAVQDPGSADFDGMPQSAIETGLADLVLAPEEIAAALVRLAKRAADERPEPDADTRARDVASVVALLRLRTNFDFRSYKSAMLWRRVQRRMGLTNVTSLPEYLEHLRSTPEELQRLRKEVLISVTGFFRDPQAFDELVEKAFRPIFSTHGDGDPVRLWVPGCATGEEAYSLAMLLHEERERAGTTTDVQVFATDLDEDALGVARAAVYPERVVVTQVTEERLGRFFVAAPDRALRVVSQVRESIVFATHDLLSDPPFSRLDAISCRNVLIYLQPDAQKRILDLFHAALKPGGVLFLGSAEGVSSPSGFEPVSSKWRIYRRVGPNRAPSPGLAFAPRGTPAPVAPHLRKDRVPQQRVPDVRGRVMDVLVDEYAPAAVAVNARAEALFLHGRVDPFLDLPRGDASLDLMGMVRPHLRAPVRVVLHQAMRGERRAGVTHTLRAGEDRAKPVRIEARPLPALDGGVAMWLVTFREVAPPPPASDPSAPSGSTDAGLVDRLEMELATAKAELQTTIEASEATNEAARASQEELMSMNEEFRSTNEELETSKEELQSLNEELSSVNNELKEKVQSLESTTNDLHNLLSSTEVATVFLDREFRIRRFTPATRRLLNLLPADVGRPFGDIAPKVRDETLLADVEQVLHDLAPIEKEVRTDEGRWYVRRVLPYRTQDNRIEGAVVTFLDIDKQKRTEHALREAKEYAESIIATLREPLLILDKDLRVRSANQAFYVKFGTSPATTEGRFIFELGTGQWDNARLRQLLEETLPRKSQVDDFEVTHAFEGLGRRTMRLNARRLAIRGAREAKEVLVLLSIQDVTAETEARLDDAARKQELEHGVQERTAELLEANRILRQTNEALDAFSWVVGHDLKEPVRAVEILLADLEGRVTELPPDLRRALATARRENRRLAELVVGLLEFSRAARIDLGEMESVSVTQVLEGPACAARYRTRVEERGAVLEAPDPDVYVRATPTSLAQILGNLVLNSVAHNPGPDPKVRVRARQAEEEGMVEIVVEDNGPGFTAAVRKRFDEGGDTTHGGGFGLAIARRAVFHLGGRMWLATSPLGGAAVHFTLSAPMDESWREKAPATRKGNATRTSSS